jgi:GT2 family glycosyltransferase
MVEISICLVTLNCWDVAQECLDSIVRSAPALSSEIIVVDNASTDGTAQLVRRKYPAVQVIENQRNVGFTRATNQAMAVARGRYLLWLNPDTILEPDSLHQLWTFLEEHPDAGIVGPKVLNADGTFQPQCRRGLPTPLASFAYMIGLHRLRPDHPTFGRYLLTHLPIDEPSRVDSVSGCCLLARREVWQQIGSADEAIFGFGEDLDWCVRAHQAGWSVWYYPQSVIVHLKGHGGVRSKPFHKVWGIHQAMWVFYRKHLRSRYAWPTTVLVGLGVSISMVLMTTRVAARRVGGAVSGPLKRGNGPAVDSSRR